MQLTHTAPSTPDAAQESLEAVDAQLATSSTPLMSTVADASANAEAPLSYSAQEAQPEGVRASAKCKLDLDPNTKPVTPATATGSALDECTQMMLAEAEELDDMCFEEDSDYLPRAGGDPPRSTVEDLQRGIVDVEYTYMQTKRMIIGVHLKDPSSVYEQVAVDIARHMRWGDVVHAQFEDGGPLPLFYNRVESIADVRNNRARAILEAIYNTSIVPPSYQFPWQAATALVMKSMQPVNASSPSTSDDASLSMKRCYKRRAESQDELVESKSETKKSRKRAKLVESDKEDSDESTSSEQDQVQLNEQPKVVKAALAQNHRQSTYATGSGSQDASWKPLDDEPVVGYTPTSPSYDPTESVDLIDSSNSYSFSLVDAKALPDDVLQFLTERAEYGVNGSISSKSSQRKIVVVGKPYYWKNRTYSFAEMPASFAKFVEAHGLEKYNSMLCNVYETKQSKIAPHMDNTALLKEGSVVSLSYAIHEEDRQECLAQMVFKSNKGSEVYPLYHGTNIEFDAFEDKKCNKTHEVRSTDRPRLNLTFRVLK